MNDQQKSEIVKTAPMRLIRLPEVRARVGLSNSTIYRWIAANKFPTPIKLGAHLIAWNEDDIDQWVKSKFATD